MKVRVLKGKSMVVNGNSYVGGVKGKDIIDSVILGRDGEKIVKEHVKLGYCEFLDFPDLPKIDIENEKEISKTEREIIEEISDVEEEKEIVVKKRRSKKAK